MLGTCCAMHLAAKIWEYAPNAQNGAVTVQRIENPLPPIEGPRNTEEHARWMADPGCAPWRDTPEYIHYLDGLPKCDICKTYAEFMVSFFQKIEPKHPTTSIP